MVSKQEQATNEARQMTIHQEGANALNVMAKAFNPMNILNASDTVTAFKCVDDCTTIGNIMKARYLYNAYKRGDCTLNGKKWKTAKKMYSDLLGEAKSTIDKYVAVGEFINDDGTNDIFKKVQKGTDAHGNEYVKKDESVKPYSFDSIPEILVVCRLYAKIENCTPDKSYIVNKASTLYQNDIISPSMTSNELKKALKEVKDELNGKKVNDDMEGSCENTNGTNGDNDNMDITRGDKNASRSIQDTEVVEENEPVLEKVKAKAFSIEIAKLLAKAVGNVVVTVDINGEKQRWAVVVEE